MERWPIFDDTYEDAIKNAEVISGIPGLVDEDDSRWELDNCRVWMWREDLKGYHDIQRKVKQLSEGIKSSVRIETGNANAESYTCYWLVETSSQVVFYWYDE